MATDCINLFPGGMLPDGTSGSIQANVVTVYSAATPTTNSPKVAGEIAEFADATADEHLNFVEAIPPTYSSAPKIRLWFKNATVQTGGVAKKVRWKAGQKCVDAADVASFGASGLTYEAVDGVSSTLDVDQAVDTVKEAVIDLTTTGIAADKVIFLFLGRDQDHADDDAVGDMHLLAARLEWTTA